MLCLRLVRVVKPQRNALYRGSKKPKSHPLLLAPSTAKTAASMLGTELKSTTCQVSRLVSPMG